MTRPEDWTVDRLRGLVCTRKHAYGKTTARLVADRLRAGGHTISPYRCPFADGPIGSGRDRTHWHVGHPPRMETIVMIARMIRGLPLIDDRQLPEPGPSQASFSVLRSTA